MTNRPGTVARTSTYALYNVALPCDTTWANQDLSSAIREIPGRRVAVNRHRGRVTHPAVAETFHLPLASVD